MPTADFAELADLAGLADLADLGLDEGGHLLIARALARLTAGERLTVTGRPLALRVHLAAWCREHGHHLVSGDGTVTGGAMPADGTLDTAGTAGTALVIVKGSAD